MSWETNLFCNIIYNRETFNSKGEVERKLEGLNNEIGKLEGEIKSLSLMTEPEKFFNKEEDILYQVTTRVSDLLEELEELHIERYKLEILLANWSYCHDENGLAIDPPEGVSWDTAFLDGDFVKTVKYPNGNI